jgi:hypothetical protein
VFEWVWDKKGKEGRIAGEWVIFPSSRNAIAKEIYNEMYKIIQHVRIFLGTEQTTLL